IGNLAQFAPVFMQQLEINACTASCPKSPPRYLFITDVANQQVAVFVTRQPGKITLYKSAPLFIIPSSTEVLTNLHPSIGTSIQMNPSRMLIYRPLGKGIGIIRFGIGLFFDHSFPPLSVKLWLLDLELFERQF